MGEKISKFTKEALNLQLEITKQMITLATNGLGLVAALAWNSVIQDAVNTYIKPYLPVSSGLVSLLIYALLITVLAVTVTYQLAKLKGKLEKSLGDSNVDNKNHG